MAAVQAFAIFELLEPILLQLPVWDVLALQRICKTWKETIENSPPLQRKLFLEPAKGQPSYIHNDPQKPGLFWLFNLRDWKEKYYRVPATAEEARDWKFLWMRIGEGRVPVQILENPVLQWLERALAEAINSEDPESHPVTRACSSWRRMVMCQGGITGHLSCDIVVGAEFEVDIRNFKVDTTFAPDSKDLTLGDIANLMCGRISLARQIRDHYNARGTSSQVVISIMGRELWDRNDQ